MSYMKLCVRTVILFTLAASNINCVSIRKYRVGYHPRPSRYQSYSYTRSDQRGTRIIPRDTVIPVIMETNLSSETNKRGDAFTARTSEPVLVGGSILLPGGTLLRGRIESITRFFRRSNMKLRFSEAVLQNGQRVQMDANEYDPKEKIGLHELAKKGGNALREMLVEQGLNTATDGALTPLFALKGIKKAHDVITEEVKEVYKKGQQIMIKLNEPMYLP